MIPVADKIEKKPKWRRVGITYGSAVVTFEDLTQYDEVCIRVQDTSSTPSRNAAITIPGSLVSTSPSKMLVYMGGYIRTDTGFGGAVEINSTSAKLISVGANGTSVSLETVWLTIDVR